MLGDQLHELWLTGGKSSWRSPLCRCVVASEWNVEGGRLYVAGYFSFGF